MNKTNKATWKLRETNFSNDDFCAGFSKILLRFILFSFPSLYAQRSQSNVTYIFIFGQCFWTDAKHSRKDIKFIFSSEISIGSDLILSIDFLEGSERLRRRNWFSNYLERSERPKRRHGFPNDLKRSERLRSGNKIEQSDCSSLS